MRTVWIYYQIGGICEVGSYILRYMKLPACLEEKIKMPCVLNSIKSAQNMFEEFDMKILKMSKVKNNQKADTNG